jgi:AraC-like DNA-binding protein
MQNPRPERPGVFGVELLGRYQNQTNVRDQLVHLLSLPALTGRDVDEPEPRQRQRRLRKDEQLELIARYKSGESVYCLAEAFVITRQTVSQILERHDVPRRYRLLTDEHLPLARQLYEEGLSLADVGERFGVSTRTVLNAFRRLGLATRPVGTNQWGGQA